MMGPMGNMWGSGMGWWMLWSGIWMLLFWGVLFALGVWAVDRLTRRRESQRPEPLDVARERFARGEIAREQYEEIRQTLTAS